MTNKKVQLSIDKCLLVKTQLSIDFCLMFLPSLYFPQCYCLITSCAGYFYFINCLCRRPRPGYFYFFLALSPPTFFLEIKDWGTTTITIIIRNTTIINLPMISSMVKRRKSITTIIIRRSLSTIITTKRTDRDQGKPWRTLTSLQPSWTRRRASSASGRRRLWRGG